MNYEVEYWTSGCFIQHDAFRLNLVIIKCIEMVSVVVDVSRITDPICFSYIYLFLVMLINKSFSYWFCSSWLFCRLRQRLTVRGTNTVPSPLGTKLYREKRSRARGCGTVRYAVWKGNTALPPIIFLMRI